MHFSWNSFPIFSIYHIRCDWLRFHITQKGHYQNWWLLRVIVYDSGTTYSQSLPCVELELIPLRESACRQGHHKFDTAGSNVGVHGPCINPNCKSRSRFICVGCTRDVDSVVWVCKPSESKPWWEMLHKARARYPVDNTGNPIERPSLTKKTAEKQQPW